MHEIEESLYSILLNLYFKCKFKKLRNISVYEKNTYTYFGPMKVTVGGVQEKHRFKN